VFHSERSTVTALVHTMYRKFITLVCQVDNVLIEARSPIKAGCLHVIQAGAEVTCSNRRSFTLFEQKVCDNCQIVEQCNDGARKMSNLEQMMEIDRMLNFKSTKVQIVVFAALLRF